MRLIDADAMEKQAYDDVHYHAELEDWEFDVVTHYLDHAPTIDAVPVVRCSQCEKWQKKEETWLCKKFGYCTECMMDCPADHFCSYGEKRCDDAV